MALLKKWRDTAYSETANKGDLQRFWNTYFEAETEIYATLLKNPDEVVTGTVKELADKYEVSVMTMTGFLDGINDSLVNPNPIDDMEEDTVVNLGFDKALLYKNMVAAKAEWLYELPMWDEIFDADTKKAKCTIQYKDFSFVGEATCHPDDYDYASERTGLYIAEMRASIQALKFKRDHEIKPMLKSLKHHFANISTSKYYNPNSYESRMLRRQIHVIENELAAATNDLAEERKYLKNYIKQKDELYSKLRAKKKQS